MDTVMWWAWIHIFCYNDRTWIKTTIPYKLLNNHHILLMGLQWIWLTKELAWGKRNKKFKKIPKQIKTITFVPPTTIKCS